MSTNQLTTEELEIAKKKLINVVQREAFPENLKALSGKRSVPKHSKLHKLEPFIDDELMISKDQG